LCFGFILAVCILEVKNCLFDFLEAAFAPLPRTARGQPIVLNGRADKKTFLYVHGSNVFLRNIEVGLALETIILCMFL